MSDTASEPARRARLVPRRWGRLPPTTLRLRLTLLYGACFLVAGAGLLGITYALFAHDTGHSQRTIRAVHLKLPASTAGVKAIVAGGGSVRGSSVGGTVRPPPQAKPGSGSALRSPKQFFEAVTSSGQRQVNGLVRRANLVIDSQRSHSLASLLTESAIALAIMALLSIGLGWLLAGRALGPLRVMNLRARKITEDTLHERLGLDGRQDELGQLAATFDAVLARLEQAFDSQRRFVANASHELRTPITLERALLEVALGDPDASVESLRRTCERVLAASEQQERVIDALLTLARGQAGLKTSEPVALDELTRELLADREIELLGVRLSTHLSPVTVEGDRALLERLVGNLLDNSIVHNSGEDPWITVRSCVSGGQAQLRVANGGEPVPAERVEELFEPFRRLERDRTETGRGLGLGLSIVRAVAVAHGGQVDVVPLAGGGLELIVRLRAVPEPRDRRQPALHSEVDASTDGVLAGSDRVHR